MYSINQPLKRFKTCKKLTKSGLEIGFLEKENGSLLLSEENKKGYYFMRNFDTLEEEMQYNRLKLKGVGREDVRLTLHILALDDLYADYNNLFTAIDDILEDSKIDPQDKIDFLIELGAKTYVNKVDVLLHHLKGRYLWIALQVYKLESTDYVLESIEIEYPMQTFTHYLPEIYQQEGGFLQAYIGIFQSLYLDIEQSIDELPKYLDIDQAPDSFLNYLASWVGIDNSEEIFSAKQLRAIIKRAEPINSAKGTKRALQELITLYTETSPRIIEYFDWDERIGLDKDRRRLYEKLYGFNASWFAVIVNKSQSPHNLYYEKLRLLIERYKPAETQYHLVLLEACNRSDRHCYLGINSYLSELKFSQINYASTLSDDVVLRLDR